MKITKIWMVQADRESVFHIHDQVDELLFEYINAGKDRPIHIIVPTARDGLQLSEHLKQKGLPVLTIIEADLSKALSRA